MTIKTTTTAVDVKMLRRVIDCPGCGGKIVMPFDAQQVSCCCGWQANRFLFKVKLPKARPIKVYVANHHRTPDGGLDAQYLRKTMVEVKPDDLIITGAFMDSHGLTIEHGVAGRLIGKSVVVNIEFNGEGGERTVTTAHEILR